MSHGTTEWEYNEMAEEMKQAKPFKQTVPNVHDVLRAIRELEKLPEVIAYLALVQSLKQE